MRSIRNTACVENNGVGENILEHNLLSAKKCGKAPKSVWKSLIFNKYLSNDPGKVDSNFFCYAATVLSPHRNVLIFTQRMHKPT